MFGMGMGELLLILVVALLVVGPDKLPQAARTIGKGIRDFRKHSRDLQSTLEQDEKLGEAVRELRSALRDEPLRPWTSPRPPTTGTSSDAGGTPSATESGSAGSAVAPAVVPAAGTVAKETPAPPTIARRDAGETHQDPQPAAEPVPETGSKADDSAHG